MRHTFLCIDGHTGGNPVRVVHGAVPNLRGRTMSEKRQDFLKHHDWIRKALMFEPRGHDMMSGAIIYPPCSDDADASILFVETSGCLPMCGHGLIGTVTIGLEHGLITPRVEGHLEIDVPAGRVSVTFTRAGDKVTGVRVRNIGSYLAHAGVEIEVEGLGPLTVDVSYGGNFYAIVDPQPGYGGLEQMRPADILRFSPKVRAAVNRAVTVVHPLDATVQGCSHVLWTGAPTEDADGRNAVFYGDKAIDRSPCGTGTSARLAQLTARGKLRVGDTYVHESIIHSRFTGRVEAATDVGGNPGIIPSIEGQAFVTGLNTIFVDDRDPFPEGFQLV
ncbi:MULTISPECIES: 4-hydroxyproline epimerase [Kordiimonas]|uniref:4-hydroxyproline epimerase n=1 Tax=Kordiimonas TaxID=288021 RepID=UPI00257E20DB|nr:4-hydroxyproline epimerase [Kordiimonas sp. UBA4487]